MQGGVRCQKLFGPEEASDHREHWSQEAQDQLQDNLDGVPTP